MTQDSAPVVPIIGVIGSDDHAGVETISEHALEVAEEVGRLVAERGGVVVSGGRGGVMTAVSRGAFKAGGIVVGLMPGLSRTEANPYITLPLATGLGGIRNHLTVRAADAVIMIAGSTGTLNEATISYGVKPLVIIEGTGGWSDRLREVLYEGAHFDFRASAEVRFTNTAVGAVEMALAGWESALRVTTNEE